MQSKYIPEAHLTLIREYLSSEDRALVDIIRLSGYRVDDILYTRDWQWAEKSISIKERKTGRLRTVVITAPLKNAVDRYRGAVRYKSTSPLRYFVPTRGNRARSRKKLHRTTIYRHFAHAVEKAGLAGRGYTIHSLRKCYAVNLLRATGSLDAVRADLGHKYITTTFIYCQAAFVVSGASESLQQFPDCCTDDNFGV